MTAFATAGCGDESVRIAVPSLASSQIHSIAFPAEGAVALELLVLWTYVITEMQKKSSVVGLWLMESIFQRKVYAGACVHFSACFCIGTVHKDAGRFLAAAFISARACALRGRVVRVMMRVRTNLCGKKGDGGWCLLIVNTYVLMPHLDASCFNY